MALLKTTFVETEEIPTFGGSVKSVGEYIDGILRGRSAADTVTVTEITLALNEADRLMLRHPTTAPTKQR